MQTGEQSSLTSPPCTADLVSNMAASDSSKLEYTCTLSEATLEMARRELNENPATRLLELKSFRDRLLQYPGLRPRTDPKFLLQFLRVSKFDQERAFGMIINYYKMRKENSAIFIDLKPSNMTHVYRSCVLLVPYPYRDRTGRDILFLYPERADQSRFTSDDIVKCYLIDNWRLLEKEDYQVRGVTLVVDFKDYSLSRFFTDTSFRLKLSRIWQDKIPNRQKLMLLVNEHALIDLVMVFFSQVLKAKLMKRVHRVGRDWNKLHEFIDPAYLPAEYGGTLPDSMDSIGQRWVDKLQECDKRMEEDGKYGFVDFTVGTDRDSHQADAFTNMPGTFRKLDQL